MDNYQVLIEKLDAFIRKYYKNKLIRGVIYAFTFSLAFYLLVTSLESVEHFNITFRTILFYSFLSGFVFILWRFVSIPLFHLYKIGKIISHEQAAQIIGRHFAEVKDKLLNVLQLKRQAEDGRPKTEDGSTSLELLTASINQKSEELKPIPFVSAVNFSENKRYLRFAAIPFFILVVVLFTAPSMIKDSTKRLIDHGVFYEKPAPFTFEILNKNLKTVQQQDFRLDIKVSGKEVPAEAFIEIGGNQFKLEKENLLNFHYTFKNIQKSTDFKLFADGFYSHEYTLEAVPNPVLTNFEINLEYPAYLNKKKEMLQNTGDLLVPAGTKVSWVFHTRNTESLLLTFQDSAVTPTRSDENAFTFTKRFLRNDSYTVRTSNQYLQNNDSVRYAVSVIPDLYPAITVEQQRDSFSSKRVYFKGLVKDDYGFTKLSFNYRFLKRTPPPVVPGDEISDSPQPVSTDQGKSTLVTEPIAINKNTTSDQFYYYWDVTNVNVNAGDELEYYFEVTDNDGVNGPKSTRSQSQIFKAPTLKEIAENTARNNENVKSDLKESIQQAKQLQKDFNELSNKVLDKKELNWDDKKKTEDLLAKQKELERKLEELKNKNQQSNEQKSEFKKEDQNILDKQKQLEDLMAKLMTPEMKKVMEELQKMMEQADKSKVEDQLKQMKNDNKDLEKELQRALELFKQMEFEQKLQDNIDKLKEMAQKQDDLSKKSDEKNADAKDLKDKQDSMNKEFEDFKKDMADLEKKNDALEEKNKMPDTEQDKKDVEQNQKESSDQLSQNKSSKASKSQKKAAQKMKEMSDKMTAAQESMEAQQQEEDEAALRALLENLLRLSFDQEALMEDLKTMDVNNPQYLKASQQQRKLKDNSKVVEDSLFALSKRNIQIQSKVNQEISAINMNMDEALNNLEDRLVPQARSRQQFAMTAINNLTLMLSESLSQMQQQAQSKQAGTGSCNKPGAGKGKKPGLAQLKKMQEELNKNMKKAKEQMEKEGNKPGKQGKPGEGEGMSEQLAKMAAQQEYIRNMMHQIDQEDNKDGRKSLGDLQGMQKQMEDVENDIVNKRITDETLKRQQDILTKLLESERAERERDQDEQRKSEEAKNYQKRNPPAFEEYKQLKLKEMELLRTVPPDLNSYYKKKVNDYFQAIEK